MRAARALVSLCLAGAGCQSQALSTLASAIVVNPSLAVSQVYGGGGNASATFSNDFVELHNRTGAPVSLSGLSVQYTSATGTGLFGASASLLVALSGTVAPGGYFLVAGASGGAVGAPLPVADASNSSLNMSGTAGKVALVSGTTPLGCNGGSTPCDAAASARIIDLVGYGNANFFEGSGPASTPSNTTAARRKGAGCTDSNSNAADFDTALPAPRNSASAASSCGPAPPTVAATVPASGATGVDPVVTPIVTFSEPVSVTAPWFTFSCSVSGTASASFSGGPTTYTITPPSTLAAGESCQLTILAAAVHDLDAGDAMPADVLVPFTVAMSGSAIGVHAVQGRAHLSPLAGQTVTVGPAVVTVRRSSGFYMEDLSPDGDEGTSEGIFVFTATAPTAVSGDVVVVRGTVSEFRPGCTPCTMSDDAFGNLTITELASPMVTVQSHGHALPPAVILGVDRVPPGQVIDDDAGGSVETAGTFDPASDGIDFYESLEGMRVRLDDPVAVGPTHVFTGSSTEIPVLARPDGGPRTPRGGIIVGPSDFNPERLILENGVVSSFPMLNVGDHFVGPVVGVMDYAFGNYKLLVSEALPPTAGTGVTPESTALVTSAPGQLTVASFNAENLDPTDPQSKFDGLARIIVTNLGAPDLLSVEEIQDDDGATDSGTVSATTTISRLLAAISAAGGPAYSSRGIDPQNDQDGGEPGGNIRQIILFRGDRGLAFVDRGGAVATTANSVDPGPHLRFSPGRIDPTNGAFASSRKPLAAELTFAGRTLFVVANHMNSKGGDQPLFGRFQPPVRSSEVQRQAQAKVIASFVASLLAAAPQAAVVLLGDLNDFSFSAAVTTIKGAGLTDLIETLPAGERYSYVFEGNSQDLDHILVSASLAPRATFDVVHVNSEFWDQASDHDPNVVRFELGGTPPVPSVPALSPAGLALLAALLLALTLGKGVTS
jgi:predicted extracellular nuclease